MPATGWPVPLSRTIPFTVTPCGFCGAGTPRPLALWPAWSDRPAPGLTRKDVFSSHVDQLMSENEFDLLRGHAGQQRLRQQVRGSEQAEDRGADRPRRHDQAHLPPHIQSSHRTASTARYRSSTGRLDRRISREQVICFPRTVAAKSANPVVQIKNTEKPPPR